MGPTKQAPKCTRKAIKRRMLDLGELTVREIARRVGHPEATVSKAINHGKYPRVRAKILETLDV